MMSRNSVSTWISLAKYFGAAGSLSSLTKRSAKFLPISLRMVITGNSQIGRKIHTSKFFLKTDADMDPKWADNPKLIPNEEWAKRLNPDQYFCTREGGTEPPFSGQYLKHKAEGIYSCVCCGSELFSSKTKYDSGSGWPSFFSAIEDNAPNNTSNVIKRKDISHGMVRNEILCNHCNSHLGHAFEDGPKPSGQRFCVNSAALKFSPKKLS